MSIDLYMWPFSPPSRAVLMLTKELNIKTNIKIIELCVGQHLQPEYLSVSPGGLVPAIDDNGYKLWESRAIMQYLCSKYGPDTQLYPKDLETRAEVDRWLYTDCTLFPFIRDVTFFSKFRSILTESTISLLKDNLKLVNQLIGDKTYLVDNHLTIADLSLSASLSFLIYYNYDLTDYPNISRWYISLSKLLPYFEEINGFTSDEANEIVSKMQKI
ncbi:unnamed protein product [Oppiella nova]|uniref:Glutathione S-transferase n=1 Tax=Oppiella nova TaxID=334625 RepID=A0A7R9QP75_9ACAR|nr:unnamed protein product [Oppiella nova]CAG2170516.1 unnamed protein product [Oppiella nova]